MTWRTIFQKYQNPELGKKGKQVDIHPQQVSQFSLFPPFGETKNQNQNQNRSQKTNNTHIQILKEKKIEADIDMEKLRSFLGEDWDDYKDNPEALVLWADLLLKNRLIEQGKAPDNFTAITWCNLCGYVYVPPALVNGGNVLGCPWCRNRVKGLSIPKPVELH